MQTVWLPSPPLFFNRTLHLSAPLHLISLMFCLISHVFASVSILCEGIGYRDLSVSPLRSIRSCAGTLVELLDINSTLWSPIKLPVALLRAPGLFHLKSFFFSLMPIDFLLWSFYSILHDNFAQPDHTGFLSAFLSHSSIFTSQRHAKQF